MKKTDRIAAFFLVSDLLRGRVMIGSRKRRGNTLTLVVTAVLVITLIAVGIDFLLMVFRQNRTLINTNDAIALNAARDAVTAPYIAIGSGPEAEQFQRVVASEYMILRAYNNLVAQVVLSASNAAADGSPEAIAYANNLIDALQKPAPKEVMSGETPPGPGMSIAARLSYALNKAARDYSKGGYVKLTQRPSGSLFSEAMADNVRFGQPIGDGKFKSRASGASVPGKDELIKDMASWMEPGGASDILIETYSMPYVINRKPPERIALNVADVNHKGKWYLPGYSEIKVSGGAASQLKPIMAFTFPEGEQPHLVSGKDYSSNQQPEFLSRIAVPPNAFKVVSAGLDQKGTANFCTAVAQVGCLRGTPPQSTDLLAAVPDMQPKVRSLPPKLPPCMAPMTLPPYVRYIEIINFGDVGFFNHDGSASQTTNVFAKELMAGIWLADNGAFSTNKTALLEWADYNNRRSPTHPPLRDGNNNLIVHGSTGTITGLKAPSAGSRAAGPCMWLHVSHGDPDYYDSQCADRLYEFETAYPPGPVQPTSPTSYMAVEQFKQTIRTAFNTCGNFGCPSQSTGLRVYTDGWPGMAPDGVADGRPARSMVNPVPEGANSRISRAGSIAELLEQVDPENAPWVLMQIEQRIRTIDYTANDQDIYNILHNRKIELGAVLFILKTTNGLEITNERPIRLKKTALDSAYLDGDKWRPIGTKQVYSSDYATIGTLVNPQREQDIHLQLYTSYPDPDQVGKGIDIAEWTAGVDIECVGRLRFKNQCAGTSAAGSTMAAAGEFCQPD